MSHDRVQPASSGNIANIAILTEERGNEKWEMRKCRSAPAASHVVTHKSIE